MAAYPPTRSPDSIKSEIEQLLSIWELDINDALELGNSQWCPTRKQLTRAATEIIDYAESVFY